MLHRSKPRIVFATRSRHARPIASRAYSATVAAITPAASIEGEPSLIARYPLTQPPSHKQPFLRKSQLHRQYTSLIESSPMMLLFQHNNLRADEWTAIRRELTLALQKAAAASPVTENPDIIRLQTIQTGIFAAALRVVDFYRPPDPAVASGAQNVETSTYTHSLSRNAYLATLQPTRSKRRTSLDLNGPKKSSPLHALLHGPIAVLTFPTVTPSLLAASLRILSPTPGSTSAFPAPRRRDAPGYYENAVQAGLQKLVLLGSRIEGRTMDGEGVRWVGGIDGGMDGLRAQLVGLLNSMGAGLTTTLEDASKSLWLTLEGRRVMLDEESKESNSQAAS